MRLFLLAFALLTLTSSCGVLHSNTFIDPNKRFILGNNEHGAFKVKLKNVSKREINVYHAPINGGKHSPQTVQPNQSVTVRVDRNTALVIDNPSMDTASVMLRVSGDIGLSMGYKK